MSNKISHISFPFTELVEKELFAKAIFKEAFMAKVKDSITGEVFIGSVTKVGFEFTIDSVRKWYFVREENDFYPECSITQIEHLHPN